VRHCALVCLYEFLSVPELCLEVFDAVFVLHRLLDSQLQLELAHLVVAAVVFCATVGIGRINLFIQWQRRPRHSGHSPQEGRVGNFFFCLKGEKNKDGDGKICRQKREKRVWQVIQKGSEREKVVSVEVKEEERKSEVLNK